MVSDKDLEIIRPQLEAAWDVIKDWPLGKDLKVMSALVVLKVIAVTSGQLKEIGVYDDIERRRFPDDGPGDGGFF